MTLKLKNGRWYLVTQIGTEVKTMFFATESEENVIKFFKKRYQMIILPRQKELYDNISR